MSSKGKEREKEKEVTDASPPVEKKKYAYRPPRLGDGFQAIVPSLDGDGLMVSISKYET